jgi:hypothetical protein
LLERRDENWVVKLVLIARAYFIRNLGILRKISPLVIRATKHEHKKNKENPINTQQRLSSCKLENSYQLMKLFVCMFHVKKYFIRLIFSRWISKIAKHKRFRLKFLHTMGSNFIWI